MAKQPSDQIDTLSAEQQLQAILAKLKVDKTTLYQTVQFYEAYPIFRRGGKLAWTETSSGSVPE